MTMIKPHSSLAIHYKSKADLMLTILRRDDISDDHKIAFIDRIRLSVLYPGEYILEITLDEYKRIFKNKF